jgi:hypothetical protein
MENHEAMNPMNEFDEEYNFRQYKLMLKSIQDYQNAAIKLPQLIADLEALRSALHSPPESWLNDFDPAWGVLEEVHSVMLDEERQFFDEVDRKLINDALARLTSVIQAQIASKEG